VKEINAYIRRQTKSLRTNLVHRLRDPITQPYRKGRFCYHPFMCYHTQQITAIR